VHKKNLPLHSFYICVSFSIFSRPLIHWSSKMAPHKLTTQTLVFIAKVTYVLLPWQHEEIWRDSGWHSLSTHAQLFRFFSAPTFIHIWRFYLLSSGHMTPYFHGKTHNFAYFITLRSHYFCTIMQYTSHFININFSSFPFLDCTYIYFKNRVKDMYHKYFFFFTSIFVPLYLQVLNMCFICLEKDFNIPSSGRCGQAAHTSRCIIQ